MSEYEVELDAGGTRTRGSSNTDSGVGVGEVAVTGTANKELGEPVRATPEPTERSAPDPLTPAGRSPSSRKRGKQKGESRVPEREGVYGSCARWMHHRKGEYCKTCGKVP